MKIQVTAGELTVMSGSLTDLTSAKMPAGVGYLVKRLAQKLGGEISLVLSQQAEIMGKYKAEKTDGEQLRMTPQNPNFKKARAEMNNLLAQEVTIEADIIILPKKVVLEPRTLLVLEKFLKVAGI